MAEKMIEAIDKVRVKGDSVGGIVTCIARNVPRVIPLLDSSLYTHNTIGKFQLMGNDGNLTGIGFSSI